MNETNSSSCRLYRAGDLYERPGPVGRRLALPLLSALAAAMLLLAPALATADSSSTLTVVGTSDVSDSGLMPNVIQPAFQKAFPQFTFKYAGSATGTAIQNAENGTGGPSALIVHAASLENQFVAGGFSYKNQFGNAIFTNDFVLGGPTADPAGASANAANNVAQAFADIANAGNLGKVTFITRGGTTTASGTTVAEHQIWALVHSSGLQPGSLSLCNVSAVDGGGMSPVKSAAENGQACPDSGTVNGLDAPSWYFVNAGANQAANVIAANACTGHPSGTCYVLSDRGTFDYLASGTDPAGSIPNLKIVTRNNSASAPGGSNALINYFHVYIISPSKPGETVNQPAAQDFVNLITSQALQAQLKNYLSHTSDPGGAPFVADAAPSVTATGLPPTYHAGKALTVTGQLTNLEPGYPALSGVPVSVDELAGGLPVQVASGRTNSTGGYSINFVPASTGSYEVSTGSISKIEIATLTPPYGDVLSPAATSPVAVTVDSETSNFHVKSQGGKALVTGSVAPGTGHVKATVAVLARRAGSRGAFKKVATERLGASQGNFAVLVSRPTGRWQFKVNYQDPKVVVAASTRTVTANIAPKPGSGVSFRSAKLKAAALTVSGSANPAPSATGAKVVLLALNTQAGKPAQFHVVKTVKLGTGKTKFTLHASLARNSQVVLQLEYLQPGTTPSFSGLRTVNVH